jgi:hypothetical protein
MLPKSSEKREKGRKDSAESWYRERWFSIAMMLKKTMSSLQRRIFLSIKDNPMLWSATHKT